MANYKCIKSFKSLRLKTYESEDKISNLEYDNLFDSEKKNFVEFEDELSCLKLVKKYSSSNKIESSIVKDKKYERAKSNSKSSSKSNRGFGFIMGDMFGTGIPGGFDMDFSTPF